MTWNRRQSGQRKPMAWNASLMDMALLHACPKVPCRADSGEPCRREDGRIMQAPHSVRYGLIPT